MTGIDDNITDAMEWHSAAAHVVASACGMHVCDGRTRRELTYNKPTFSQDWVTVA
jgi:3'-phosphoadenosine 5'-phosphosulfate (PAPS) 3'-phosphatase